MEATKLLEAQHKSVAGLIEKIEKALEKGEDGMKTHELFHELADQFAAHARIEEALFYPAVYVGDMKPLLQEAVEEHLSVKRILADLLDLAPADEQFLPKLKVLKEQIEHHVEEEEGDLFKKVRKSFEKDELESLGEQMEEMFAAVLAEEPRKDVPAETGEAAPLN